MDDEELPTDEQARYLLFTLAWNGPWERLEEFFYGIRKDATLRWDIPANPRGWRWALGVAGDFCDRRHIAWRRRHITRGTTPWHGWRRT